MSEKIARCGLWAVICAGALILTLRALSGPFTFLVRVDSPMNVEAILGLSLALAIVARTESTAGREEAGREMPPGWFWPGSLALLLLIAVAFHRALLFYFLADDFVLVHVGNSTSPADFPALFSIEKTYGFYRPIAKFSLAVNSIWAKYDPAAWHASNLLLHFVNSLLVLTLAARLCNSRFSALFAALLFSIHGTRPEAVVWIAGRFDLLATCFVLSGLILFMQSLQERTLKSRRHRLLSMACMVLAILSKEAAYIFPLLLVLALVLRRDSMRRRIRVTAPFFLVAAALLIHRLILFDGIGGYRDARSGLPNALALDLLPATKVMLLRLWAVLFFPVNWNVQPGVLFAFLMMCGVISLGWLTLRRTDRRSMAFSLGFVVVAVIPPLHMMLIGSDLEKSRLVYLASAGFSLMLALAAERLQGRTRWIVPGLILVFNLFVLNRNLSTWEYASARAQSACAAAADCAGLTAGKIMVAGMPLILRGVYFFGNGFPECVKMRRGDPSLIVELLQGNPASGEGEGVRLMRWDSSSDSLRCAEERDNPVK